MLGLSLQTFFKFKKNLQINNYMDYSLEKLGQPRFLIPIFLLNRIYLASYFNMVGHHLKG